jgi:hypothetical protein
MVPMTFSFTHTKKQPWPLLVLLLACSPWLPRPAHAQRQVSASVFNNAIALPGSALLSPLHPGLDVGLSTRYRQGRRHERFLHTQLGLYHQRLVHTGGQLYSEYHLRYRPLPFVGIEPAVGLGALMTRLDTERFLRNDRGDYTAANKTRLHAQLSAALGLTFGQRSSRLQPFVSYRMRLFTPFVNSYVPVAPSTSLHLGTYYRLNRP